MKILRAGGAIAVMALIVAAGAWAKSETHPFSIGGQAGDRQEFSFRVPAAGTVRVEARWTGSPAKLTLILNGPGRTGYYQRLDDRSPLVVVQDVTAEILEKGNEWKVSVVDFGKSGSARGTVTISYPEEFQTQRYDKFDKVAISGVEKVAVDRLLLTVEYVIERPHAREVFVGAAVLNDGLELSAFGFRPARAAEGRGQARVEVIYQGGLAPGRITTDQIAVYLYEGGRKPYCRVIHDLSLAWYK